MTDRDLTKLTAQDVCWWLEEVICEEAGRLTKRLMAARAARAARAALEGK